MKIFLIGMPGSGKSTIGRYMASQLRLPIVDLDKNIEEHSGKSISQIFDEIGEDGFRELERIALHKVINQDENQIVSTGGGAPCFYDNMEQMKLAGKTIYIDVPVETLIERTSRSSKRPLLRKDPGKKISELLEAREKYYKSAEVIYSTNGRDSTEVAREITAMLSNTD